MSRSGLMLMLVVLTENLPYHAVVDAPFLYITLGGVIGMESMTAKQQLS